MQSPIWQSLHLIIDGVDHPPWARILRVLVHCNPTYDQEGQKNTLSVCL